MLFGLLSAINSVSVSVPAEPLVTPTSFAANPYPSSAPTGIKLTWTDSNETLRRFLRHRIFGSSTAAGSGASDSAHRCTNLYKDAIVAEGYTLGQTYDNIALGGYTTYHYRETGYTPPADRPSPDPNHNITKLMSLGTTDIAICMNGGNDVVNAVIGGYSNSEIQANYIAIDNQLTAAGIIFFPTTLFPRTGATYAQRQRIEFLSNWILSYFGDRAINLFEMLVWRTPGDTSTDLTAKVEYRYTLDETHFNDLAHGLISDKLVEHVGDYINSTAKIASYEIYRSASSGGVYTLIGTAAAMALEYTDTTAVVGTAYYYKIKAKAVSGFADADYTGVANATIPGVTLLQTMYLNFGGTSTNPLYNNITTANNTTPLALINDSGAASGITIKGSSFSQITTGDFPWAGTSFSFPDDVMKTAFNNQVARNLTITGRSGKKYMLVLTGSRSNSGGASGSRVTSWVHGSEVPSLECFQNKTHWVTLGETEHMALDVSNNIVIAVTPGSAGQAYTNCGILYEYGTP